jgi:hypothetical protein
MDEFYTNMPGPLAIEKLNELWSLASGLPTMGDIIVTSPTLNDLLVYNGSAWTNRPLTKADVGLSEVPNENPITFSRTFMLMGA